MVVSRAEWISIVALVISAGALVVTYLGWRVNRRKELREMAAGDPSLVVDCRPVPNWPGWHEIRIDIENNLDTALHITQFRCVRPGGGKIIHRQKGQVDQAALNQEAALLPEPPADAGPTTGANFRLAPAGAAVAILGRVADLSKQRLRLLYRPGSQVAFATLEFDFERSDDRSRRKSMRFTVKLVTDSAKAANDR